MNHHRKTLITGGTGKLGTVLSSVFSKNNMPYQILTSRELPPQSPLVYGNLTDGTGLQQALKGVEVIAHCASSFFDHQKVDVVGTENLIKNIDYSSIKLLVYISIVGVDQIPLPYYESKRKAEKIIQQSGVPHLILRFTQFHDFILYLLEDFANNSHSSHFLEIPQRLHFQSIGMEDVANTILSNTQQPNTGLLEIGGPKIETLDQMAESFLKIKKIDKKIKMFEAKHPLHIAFIGGKNIAGNALKNGITWDHFLSSSD